MKIEELLSENNAFGSVYKQLTPLQIGLLRKIAADRFDYDNASPQAQDAVDGMIALGLVNDISLDITDDGTQALEVANQVGSVDRQNLINAKNQQQNQKTEYINEPDEPVEQF